MHYHYKFKINLKGLKCEKIILFLYSIAKFWLCKNIFITNNNKKFKIFIVSIKQHKLKI